MPIAKDPEKLLSSLETNLLSRYRYGSVLQRLAKEVSDLEAQKRDIEARLTAATQSRDEAQNGFANIETSIQEIRGEIVAAGADVDLMHRVAEARLNVLIESKVLDPDAPILLVKTSRGRGRPKTIRVGSQAAARDAGQPAEAKQPEATEAEQSAAPVEPVKAEAPKAEEPVKVAEAPKAEEPVKVAEAPKAEEPVKVAEAPKAEEPVKVAEAPKAVEPLKVAEAPKAEEPPPVVMPARRAAKPIVVEGDDAQVEPEAKPEQDAKPAAASPKQVEQPAPPVVMPSPRQRPAVIAPEPQPRQADESASHVQAAPVEPDLDQDNPMAGILNELFPGVG
ncbi:hypothetical protein [Acidiphilium sp. C61]|uniref:hypothetical protein n=1 Tax=Acidiphilium sp. C61 TaxID=1671485 RepID=UPI00157AC4DA|nr:hypothetical protein [Acidiphilium sp. C61]